jgi:hypothetical protein
MQPMNIPYELLDEIQGYISKNLEAKLKELFEDQTVEVETSLFIPQHEDKADVTIVISIGTKFYEISEAIASNVEQYCARKELTDEECEKAYEEAYKEELEEINRDHTIAVEGRIMIEIDKDSKAEVEIYPLMCNGDYCIAGLGINIYTYQIPLDLLDKNKDVIIDTIVKFIDSIYDLYIYL